MIICQQENQNKEEQQQDHHRYLVLSDGEDKNQGRLWNSSQMVNTIHWFSRHSFGHFFHVN